MCNVKYSLYTVHCTLNKIHRQERSIPLLLSAAAPTLRPEVMEVLEIPEPSVINKLSLMIFFYKGPNMFFLVIFLVLFFESKKACPKAPLQMPYGIINTVLSSSNYKYVPNTIMVSNILPNSLSPHEGISEYDIHIWGLKYLDFAIAI